MTSEYTITVKHNGKRKQIRKYFKSKTAAQAYANQYNYIHKGASAKVVTMKEPYRGKFMGSGAGDNY